MPDRETNKSTGGAHKRRVVIGEGFRVHRSIADEVLGISWSLIRGDGLWLAPEDSSAVWWGWWAGPHPLCTFTWWLNCTCVAMKLDLARLLAASWSSSGTSFIYFFLFFSPCMCCVSMTVSLDRVLFPAAGSCDSTCMTVSVWQWVLTLFSDCMTVSLALVLFPAAGSSKCTCKTISVWQGVWTLFFDCMTVSLDLVLVLAAGSTECTWPCSLYKSESWPCSLAVQQWV